jgi:hypothetical protein
MLCENKSAETWLRLNTAMKNKKRSKQDHSQNSRNLFQSKTVALGAACKKLSRFVYQKTKSISLSQEVPHEIPGIAET